MKKTISILRILTAVQKLGDATYDQVAEIVGRSYKITRLHVHHYQLLDFLERINPGERPAVHRLSEKGTSLMGGHHAKTGSKSRRESVVDEAMRTQPNSVFALGAKQ